MLDITAVCLAAYNIRIHRNSDINEHDCINVRLKRLLRSSFTILRVKISQSVIHFIDVVARLETRQYASLMKQNYPGLDILEWSTAHQPVLQNDRKGRHVTL